MPSQRTASLLLVLALAAPALAGCLAARDDPAGTLLAPLRPSPARLACFPANGTSAPACNFEATTTMEEGNEVSIAVNPTDPLNVVATAKDYTERSAGDCVWDGLYVTKDGGRTWTNLHAPGSNWARAADPGEPVTPLSKYWCATDPVVAFGPDGTLYWTVMGYQCDPLSASPTGAGVLPQGGLNDWLFTCSGMYVLISRDGGETWPVEDIHEVAVGPLLMHDKQWIEASPDGERVLLCWAASAVATGDTACSVSNDAGATWSQWQLTGVQGFDPALAFDSRGKAYMAFLGDRGVELSTSEDGVAWSEPVLVGTFEDAPIGAYERPTLEGSEFRVNAMPSIAVDRSGGERTGAIYVTWMDHATGDGEILLAASFDGGETFEEPVRVNDDAVDSGADQFMPAVSVGPDGIVDVSFYDRRDDPANHLFHLYYAWSSNGRTFSSNVRVTDVPSDEQYSHHQNGMVFLGDYRDSDSSRGAAHLVWVDTRNGVADVFVATVLRGAAADEALPAGAVALEA